MLIAAFDPGRNIGFALVDGEGRLLRRAVIDSAALTKLELPSEAVVVVGDGTGAAALQAALRERGVVAEVVPEAGTTLEGRELYFRDHRPRIPWRWLPKGLWSASRPIDDYAAYAIALRFLRDEVHGAGRGW